MEDEYIQYDRNGIRILPTCEWARGRRVRCNKLSISKKLEIMAKTGGRCRTCLMPLTIKYNRINSLTIDHHRPRYSGGDNRFSNLWPMCQECNCEKGFKFPRKKRKNE